MLKIVEVLKIKIETETGYLLKGSQFGNNYATFKGFGFSPNVEPAEFAYDLSRYYGDPIFAIFDKYPEGLKDLEKQYIIDALRGERFYNIIKYEALEINGAYIPLNIIEVLGGYYITDIKDLETAIKDFTEDIKGVRLVLDDEDVNEHEIKNLAESLGVKKILKNETIEIFK